MSRRAISSTSSHSSVKVVSGKFCFSSCKEKEPGGYRSRRKTKVVVPPEKKFDVVKRKYTNIIYTLCRTFCLDHRTETAHQCPHEGKWAAARLRREIGSSSSTTPTSSSGHTLGSATTTCAHPQCKTTINTSRTPGVLCPQCKRQYCLSHRLQDSHDCATLPPPLAGASVTAKVSVAKAALARFKAWKMTTSSSPGEEDKKKRTGRGGRNNAMAELMRLKREAGGDQKVPMEKRIWVYVEAEKSSTTSKLPKGEFFYSKVCLRSFLFFSFFFFFFFFFVACRSVIYIYIYIWEN